MERCLKLTSYLKKNKSQMLKNALINKKILIFFILAAIIFYRSPHILIEGRFLEEEGSIWYRNVF